MSHLIQESSSETIANGPKRARCDLCGLPVGRSTAQLKLRDHLFRFCCPGCLYVYQILSSAPEGPPAEFKGTDLFKSCMASGLIPRNAEDLLSREEEGKKPTCSEGIDGKLALGLSFKVEGMWCPACSLLIEEILRKTKGIVEGRVSFVSDLAQVRYLPHEINIETIFERVSALGYHPSRLEDPSESSRERKDLVLRLGLSSFLTANIMMISFVLYLGFFHDLGKEAVHYLSYPLWALATPVIFYGGFPILKRAAIGLRWFSASMDTLISIGSLSAYFYSVFSLLRGSLHVYFDTSSMLITLVLLGRYIEVRSREKLSGGIADLVRITQQKVRLRLEGAERWVSSERVEPEQVFVVLAGEKTPIDGRVLSGIGNVDESILTGESRPVRKKAGDEVMAGTLVLDRALTLRAARKDGGSFLEQMIRLVQNALLQKNTYEIFAERVMRWFVPLLLILAGGTGLTLLIQGVSIEVALLRTITVLVITCPCAFGIASPLSKVAAIAAARKVGILVRDPEALEAARELDVFILDKTGTLTHGDFCLQEVITQTAGRKETLRRIASVENCCDHFLAREVVRAAREDCIEFEQAPSFQHLEGLGVKGRVFNSEVVIGNRLMLSGNGMAVPPEIEEKARRFESKGMTVVFFGWDGVTQGLLVFGDSLKEGAGRAVEALKRVAEVWLVSGDSKETTLAVARALRIDHVQGEAPPEDKWALVKKLQEKGRRVGMAGDGFNDAAALAQADVGIAVGTRTNLAREASDISILAEDPAKIVDVIALSDSTTRIIRQNFLFAFLYNSLGIPLAVMGYLNPLIAVFAMFASSLTVIGNTLRVFRKNRCGIRGEEEGREEDRRIMGFHRGSAAGESLE